MQDWDYGSLVKRKQKHRTLLGEPYIELYEDWLEYVNTPIKRGELATIRNSVNRQASLGQEQWQLEIATKYGMLSTLNQRGRPQCQ